MHEQVSAFSTVKVGSSRSFGIVFAFFFAIVALFPVLGGGSLRWWALAASAVFLALAFAAPKILTPFTILWFKLGMLLNRIVGPVVMMILFFLIFTPFSVLVRMIKGDFLALSPARGTKSYWKPRLSGNSDMRKQF